MTLAYRHAVALGRLDTILRDVGRLRTDQEKIQRALAVLDTLAADEAADRGKDTQR